MKDQKKLFRPIILAEMSAETPSVFNLLSVYLHKELLSAETPSFGIKYIYTIILCTCVVVHPGVCSNRA